MNWKLLVFIPAGFLIAYLIIVGYNSLETHVINNNLFSANVQIIDYNLDTQQTQYTAEYILSGRAVNLGGGTSNPVIIQVTFKDENNNIIDTVTAAPEPSMLGPKQEAPFYKTFTNPVLINYEDTLYYEIEIISQ